MRKNLFFLFVMALAVIFSSCDELTDDKEDTNGKVSFSVAEKALKAFNSETVEGVGLDDATQAVISISKGEQVLAEFDNATLELNNWGNGNYTTKSIELEVGDDYALTTFMLKNADGEVIYAAPVSGSPVDSLVTEPLPVSFSVSSGEVTPVNVEVVTTQGKNPQDFGYSDFTVAVASDYISDTVYISDVKMDFENVGMAFMDKSMGVMETNSMLLMESFAYYLDMADPFGEEESESEPVMEEFSASHFKAFRVIYNANEVKQGKRSFDQLLSYNEDEPETIQEVYDSLTGEYTWNEDTREWDITESDQVIFRFPSKINETQVHQSENNAVFTISEYTGTPVSIKYVDEGDYSGDVPKSLKMNMTLDGEEVMSYVMSAQYNGDGFPSSINQSLVMDDYKFSSAFSNDKSTLVTSFDFEKGTAPLYSSEITVEGDYSITSLDNDVIEYWAYDETSDEDVQISESEKENYDDWWVEVYPERVTDGASMSFTLMNDVKLAGSVEIKTLVDEYERLDQGEWTNETDKEYIDIVDENVELYAAYVEDNKKIADVEIYPYESEDTYWEYEWDPDLMEYVEQEITETYIDPMVILNFSDGSKVDFGTYYDASDWGVMELQQIITFIMKDI